VSGSWQAERGSRRRRRHPRDNPRTEVGEDVSGFIVEKHNKHTIAKVGESTNRHGGKNVTITK